MKAAKDQDLVLLDSRKVILLIEDDGTIIDVTKMVLESLGYHVLVAPNGDSGLKLFRQHTEEIDLVLLDLIMPGMSGEDVLVEMKSIRHDLKVLIYSVKDRKELNQDVVSQASGFLDKPFDIEHLKSRIGSMLNC